MHTLSQPPSDRTETPDRSPGPEDILAGNALREAIRATKLSNAALGVKIGKSAGLISLWLNDKYTGDNAGVEIGLREFLRDHSLAAVDGVATIETEVSRAICRKIEEARLLREIIVIVGYMGNMIEEWLLKHYTIKFTFVTQKELLGLAHAIWM